MRSYKGECTFVQKAGLVDTNWLEDFVCLARTLNFTRAAEQRNVTQSAFSKRIKSLEVWAGTSLVDRTSYPPKLTEAGESLLPIAKSTVIDLIQTRDEIRANERGGLRFWSFAATHTISITHLAPLVSRLEVVDRSIRTRVVSDNLHECCRLLADEACDFLLCYRHPRIAMALDENRFSRIDLATESLLPVSSANEEGAPLWSLPGDRKNPVPHLAYSNGSFMGTVVSDLLKQRNAVLSVRHMDALSEALKSFAKQGAGVAWLPECSIATDLQNGTLVHAGDESFRCTLTLSMFTATARLDETGKRIWQLLSESGSGTSASS